MIRIIFLSLLGLSAGQLCPPSEVLFPCQCSEDPVTQIIQCVGIEESFNLKGIFDNASAYVNDDVIFEYLFIGDTAITEIEEGAIQHLKFAHIVIQYNPNLTYISPRAFNASRDVTEVLNLGNNQIQNEAPYERDIFDFISGFKNLVTLYLTFEWISSIPDNAFQNLDSLGVIVITSNQISSIGSRAFSGAPKLFFVTLYGNSIPSEGIPGDAFADMTSLEEVELRCNGMSFMEQKSFQPLLDQTRTRLQVGGSCVEGGGFERFYCDERANWICENEEKYRAVLTGFRCKAESGFLNVWEYCEGRNSTIAKPLAQ